MKKNSKKIVTVIIFICAFIYQHYFEGDYIQKKNTSYYVEPQLISLLRVVDGDTLLVRIDGKKERVRLIGMNTSESVKKNHPVECFSKEASAYAKEVLKNKKLVFQSDITQDSHDRFGRLLGYVFVDGENFAEWMIEEGYAHEYAYKNKSYRYESEFRLAENNARNKKRGFWADEVCN